MKLNAEVKVGHTTLLANLLLGCYIVISVFVLYYFYRAGLQKGLAEEAAKDYEIERLLVLKQDDTEKLGGLQKERTRLSRELEGLKEKYKDETIRASRNEDEILEEMVALEEKLNQNMQLQEEQQEEIELLKERIEQYDKLKNKGQKQRINASNSAQKRFNTLYKNVEIHNRAISGYLNLTGDLQLKAEELIHQLNADPKIVTIKRKVFGKKNRETVFEVLFAYKGRLYFRNLKGNRTEILTIGTKHTQGKDLDFLDKL